MKKKILFWIGTVLSLMLLPVVMTGFLSGWEQIRFVQRADWERRLPLLLAEQIPPDAPPEALKAQAVLARSNLYLQTENGTYPPAEKTEADLTVYKRAVKETRGQVLYAAGKVCMGAYHRCNAGSTRSGQEVFRDADHAWLESVGSSWDLRSEEYLTTVFVTKRELAEKMRNLTGRENIEETNVSDAITLEEKDSQGYVTKVRVSNYLISGEKFRKALNLPSACFTIQDAGTNIRFLCKGSGHGFGMSQYGAVELAKEGKTCEEILAYYFPETEIICIEPKKSGNSINDKKTAVRQFLKRYKK